MTTTITITSDDPKVLRAVLTALEPSSTGPFVGTTDVLAAPAPARARAKVQHGFFNYGMPVEIANLEQFCRLKGYDVQALYALRNGSRESYRGWTYRAPAEAEEPCPYRSMP